MKNIKSALFAMGLMIGSVGVAQDVPSLFNNPFASATDASTLNRNNPSEDAVSGCITEMAWESLKKRTPALNRFLDRYYKKSQ